MSLWESVKMALEAIRAHKMRSILTMLGIVIGVSSVIVTVAIGQGGQDKLTEAFAGSGNILSIQPSADVFMENNGVVPPDFFTQEDIRGLEQLPQVEKVITTSYQSADVGFKEEKLNGAMVYGINSNAMFETNNREVKKGTMFQPSDFQGGGASALINNKAAEELFEGKNPIGKIIRINNYPLVVSGVLAPQEGLFGSFESTTIYMTDRTWARVFGNYDINQLDLEVKDASQMKEAGDRAVDLLHRNHHTEDEYMVQNMEQITKGISQVTGIMTTVIGSIAGISLLVGGIGVMNIMLVSVTERTREIGIRMSVGATRRNIMTQFLIESVTLSVIGGLIGILLGVGISQLVNLLSPLPATVSLPVGIGAVLFSMMFGVVFGLLPANKASRLDPIDCLRRE